MTCQKFQQSTWTTWVARLDGGIGGKEGMGVELGIGVTMGRRPPAFDTNNPRNRKSHRFPSLMLQGSVNWWDLVGPIRGTTWHFVITTLAWDIMPFDIVLVAVLGDRRPFVDDFDQKFHFDIFPSNYCHFNNRKNVTDVHWLWLPKSHPPRLELGESNASSDFIGH